MWGQGKKQRKYMLNSCITIHIVLFIFRMKLLHQVSRVWRTDGLTSCIYKLLSVDYNPLYTNITVDFWSGAWPWIFWWRSEELNILLQ